MNKALPIALAILVSGSLFGCTPSSGTEEPPKPPPQTQPADEKAAVTTLVEQFGQRLQAVSLSDPSDRVKQSMQTQYGDLVSPELLAQWQANPRVAPGRLTSSPWPDRIDVRSVEHVRAGYRVTGEVIEVTSVEKVKGGAAAKRPITLEVEKINDRWVITAVTLAPYENAEKVTYQNPEYGFSFPLPASWQGYTIVPGTWEGYAVGSSSGQQLVETGPTLSIRHPLWTEQRPRQDIPIMIFTVDQWKRLEAGAFHVSAGPVGPSELGRNAQFVFALPPRYNYAFPPGYEEVESIVRGNALRPETPSK
ncbi:MAG TPA: hypothetical protein VD973_23260 [Symbiobacteriaceae bacterium]|nr:hypothetical protein [Symbiobacteriaceae bacterium]